jgi:anthranilate phosphoribosyltransferase
MDEIGPEGDTIIWEVNGDVITSYTVNPSTFGLPEHSVKEVAGSGPKENAETFRNILKGSFFLHSLFRVMVVFFFLRKSLLPFIPFAHLHL